MLSEAIRCGKHAENTVRARYAFLPPEVCTFQYEYSSICNPIPLDEGGDSVSTTSPS